MIRRVQMRTEDTVVLANETKEFYGYILVSEYDMYILKFNPFDKRWGWISLVRPKIYYGLNFKKFFDAINYGLKEGHTVHEFNTARDLIDLMEEYEEIFNYEV